jgi:hypothetical protein
MVVRAAQAVVVTADVVEQVVRGQPIPVVGAEEVELAVLGEVAVPALS